MNTQNPSATPSSTRMSRLAWKVGGANVELLEDAPAHEQDKFRIIGILNIFFAVLIGIASGFSFGFRSWHSGNDVLLQDMLHDEFVLAGSFCVSALVLTLLQSSCRVLQKTGKSVALAMMLGFPVAAWMLLLDSLLSDYVELFFSLRFDEKVNVGLLFSVELWFLLAPGFIKLFWASPYYDEALQVSTEMVEDGYAIAMDSHDASSTLSGKNIRREKILQARFDKNPSDMGVAQKLLNIKLKNKDYDAASQIYDALLSFYPENIELIKQKAALYKDVDEFRYVKTLEHAERISTKHSFLENLGKLITVKNIEIKDLDFFGDFTWGFQSGVNVLLGKNGYGKSHLLRALVAMLQKEEEITQVFFQNSRHKASIRVDIEKDGSLDSSLRSPLLFEKSFGKIPVLAIPDMRYIEKSGDSIGAPNDKMTDLKSQSAWHFLHEASYEGLITKFLYDLCLDYLDKKTFDLPVFYLMEEIVGKLANTHFKFKEILRKDSARFQILVMTDGNEHLLPLQKASQGTLSVLAMFGMIYRYLSAIYAEAVPEDKLKLQRAIVVIDEIDAHLHPSWQQKVLQLLCDTFPNIQFIVTAHSPLVIAGRKEREVAVLRKTENGFSVNVLEEHFIGATSLDIYRRIFDVEEKDETYLRLNTLASGKGELERRVAELEALATRTPQQEMELDTLSDQLYYLSQFESVRDKKQKEDNLKDENNKLTLEIMRLQGEANRLRQEVAEIRQQCPEREVSSTVDKQP